jgi:predicted nucleic acid-binding protein
LRDGFRLGKATNDATKPGVPALHQAVQLGLLASVEEGNPDAFPSLDPGESTVVSAAAASGAMALVDERKARALIASDPRLVTTIPHVTGILGVLLLAKHRGVLTSVRPILDDLIRQNFWIAPALYDDVLREAGEMSKRDDP